VADTSAASKLHRIAHFHSYSKGYVNLEYLENLGTVSKQVSK